MMSSHINRNASPLMHVHQSEPNPWVIFTLTAWRFQTLPHVCEWESFSDKTHLHRKMLISRPMLHSCIVTLNVLVQIKQLQDSAQILLWFELRILHSSSALPPLEWGAEHFYLGGFGNVRVLATAYAAWYFLLACSHFTKQNVHVPGFYLKYITVSLELLLSVLYLLPF